MKLSIIIPVYNLENYISKCIDSILNQDFDDFEILIVDDGSTDTSLSICQIYAQKDKRIRVFHQKNSGVSIARNNGISNAKGEWICFIDGDDWIKENSLNKIFSSKKEDLEIIIVRSFIHNGIDVGVERYKFDLSLVGTTYTGNDIAFEKGYLRGSVWGVFFKKDFIVNNLIIFPPTLKNGEDTIFLSISFIYAQKIGFMDVEYYYVFEREGSASRAWSFERVLYMVNNIKYINNYIASNSGLSTDALSILHYNIYRVISLIYNSFYKCFSLKNHFILTYRIKKELKRKIDSGKIPTSKLKIKLINFSLNIFAISVLVNNTMRNIK